MIWRYLERADLATCLEIQPACIGDEIVGREKAVAIWNDLLASRSFHGIVIESDPPIAGHKIVGCGLGAFVSAEFVDKELADPRPGLNSRIVGSIGSGRPVTLNYHQLARGNAESGLDFVNMYGTWRDGILDAQQLSELKALLAYSWIVDHAGYRINRILKEAIGDPRVGLAQATGFWRTIREFPELCRALVMVDRDSAFSVPYSAGSVIYHYNEPLLGLSDADQRLLLTALGGATDSELAAKLGTSTASIKRRWFRLFERVELALPNLFAAGSEGEGRGPQKRHHLLSYVRANPEELRPYPKKARPRRMNAKVRAHREASQTPRNALLPRSKRDSLARSSPSVSNSY